jgi:mannosyltransferase
MNKGQVKEQPFWTEKRVTLCLLVGILLLAFSLRLNELDAKCVWQDEIFTAAIASAENSVSEVLSIPLYNTALPAPPLYFLITHFFLYIGDNDFLLRFSALFFGILGVPVTYILGARLFGKLEGLVGAFLLSFATLHIRYSQDARFYSLLMLLSLLSLYFLYRGIFDKGRRWWIGFTLCSILNIYNHLFAFFVLLAEAIFVVGLWLAEAFLAVRRSSSVKQKTGLEKSAPTLDKGAGLAFIASLAATTLAYTPMFPHLLRGLTGSKGLGGTATRGMSVTLSFLMQQFDAWGVGSGWAIWVLLVPFLIGVIVSVKAWRGQLLWLAFCWFVVPFGVLFAIPAQHGFRPRYVLPMLPLYLLFAAKGLTTTSEVIGAGLLRGRLQLRGGILAVFLLTVALLSMPGVQAYYAEDRANWRAAAALLATSLSPGDVIVSPGAFAQIGLPRYQDSLGDVSFVMGGSEVFFSPDRDRQEGLWFIGLQEGRMSAIESELAEAVTSYFKVVIKVDDQSVDRSRFLKIAPVMYRDVWILYVREDLGPQEVIQLYEGASEVVPSSTALSIHVTLGDLYRSEGELEEALVHYQEASVLDPSAPEPHYGLALVYQAQGLQEQYASEWQKYEELTAQ